MYLGSVRLRRMIFLHCTVRYRYINMTEQVESTDVLSNGNDYLK